LKYTLIPPMAFTDAILFAAGLPTRFHKICKTFRISSSKTFAVYLAFISCI